MKVGERVKNRLLGPPMTGTIVDLVDASTYAACLTLAGWDNRYPNWREEQVAFVQHDFPARRLTLDEAIAFGMTRKEWEELPLCSVTTFPIRELLYIL